MKDGAGATRKSNDGFVRKFGIRIAVYSGSRVGGETGNLKVKSCAVEVERLRSLQNGARPLSWWATSVHGGYESKIMSWPSVEIPPFPAFVQERRSLINDHE